MPTPAYRPTPGVLTALKLLADGGMLVPDQHNILRIGEAIVTQSTRTVLMRERLVTRADKTRDIKAKGNGFILSDAGRAMISGHG